jgi:hypothetical protein
VSYPRKKGQPQGRSPCLSPTRLADGLGPEGSPSLLEAETHPERWFPRPARRGLGDWVSYGGSASRRLRCRCHPMNGPSGVSIRRSALRPIGVVSVRPAWYITRSECVRARPLLREAFSFRQARHAPPSATSHRWGERRAVQPSSGLEKSAN